MVAVGLAVLTDFYELEKVNDTCLTFGFVDKKLQAIWLRMKSKNC